MSRVQTHRWWTALDGAGVGARLAELDRELSDTAFETTHGTLEVTGLEVNHPERVIVRGSWAGSYDADRAAPEIQKGLERALRGAQIRGVAVRAIMPPSAAVPVTAPAGGSPSLERMHTLACARPRPPAAQLVPRETLERLPVKASRVKLPRDWPDLRYEMGQEGAAYAMAMAGEWPVPEALLDAAVERLNRHDGPLERAAPTAKPSWVKRYEAGQVDDEIRAILRDYYAATPIIGRLPTLVSVPGGKNAPSHREVLLNNPLLLLETIQRITEGSPPAGVTREYVTGFFQRNHTALLAVTTQIAGEARGKAATAPPAPAAAPTPLRPTPGLDPALVALLDKLLPGFIGTANKLLVTRKSNGTVHEILERLFGTEDFSDTKLIGDRAGLRWGVRRHLESWNQTGGGFMVYRATGPAHYDDEEDDGIDRCDHGVVGSGGCPECDERSAFRASTTPIDRDTIAQLGPGSKVRFKYGWNPVTYDEGEVLGKYLAPGNTGDEWVVVSAAHGQMAVSEHMIVAATPGKAAAKPDPYAKPAAADDYGDPFKEVAATAGPGNWARLVQMFTSDTLEVARLIGELDALGVPDGEDALGLLSVWDDAPASLAEAGIRRKRPSLTEIAQMQRYAPRSRSGRNADAPASSHPVTSEERGRVYAQLFKDSGAEVLLRMDTKEVLAALQAFDDDAKKPRGSYEARDIREFRAGVAAVAGAASIPTPEGGTAGPMITDEEATEGRRVVVEVNPEGWRHGYVHTRHSFVTTTGRVNYDATGLVPGPVKREVSYQIEVQMDSGRKVHHHDGKMRAELARPPGEIALDVVAPNYGGRPEPMSPEWFWTKVGEAFRGIAFGLEKADAARIPAKKAEWRKSAEASRVKVVGLLQTLDDWMASDRPRYPWPVPWEADDHVLRMMRLAVQPSRTSMEDGELALLKAVPKDFRSRVKVGDPVRTLIFDGAQRQADGWWLVGIDGNDASLSTSDPAHGPAPVRLTVKLWMVRLDAAAKARAASAAARPAASAAAPGSDARPDGSDPPYAFLAALEKAGHKGKAIYIRDLSALVTPPDSQGWGRVSRGTVAKVAKQYFAAHGLDVRTTVDSGAGISTVTFRAPPNTDPMARHRREEWSDRDIARMHELMGGTRMWGKESARIEPFHKEGREGNPMADDYGTASGPTIPAAYVEEFATLLALAEKAEDHVLTPEGEELVERRRARGAAAMRELRGTHTIGQAVPGGYPEEGYGRTLPAMTRQVYGGVTKDAREEAAAGCVDTTFTLDGYGSIRVVCGQEGRRDVWHNVYVGSTRYGYNGGRWAKGQQPPAAVMAAVRERGITTFGRA